MFQGEILHVEVPFYVPYLLLPELASVCKSDMLIYVIVLLFAYVSVSEQIIPGPVLVSNPLV